jgi:hypothetical protein
MRSCLRSVFERADPSGLLVRLLAKRNTMSGRPMYACACKPRNWRRFAATCVHSRPRLATRSKPANLRNHGSFKVLRRISRELCQREGREFESLHPLQFLAVGENGGEIPSAAGIAAAAMVHRGGRGGRDGPSRAPAAAPTGPPHRREPARAPTPGTHVIRRCHRARERWFQPRRRVAEVLLWSTFPLPRARALVHALASRSRPVWSLGGRRSPSVWCRCPRSKRSPAPALGRRAIGRPGRPGSTRSG